MKYLIFILLLSGCTQKTGVYINNWGECWHDATRVCRTICHPNVRGKGREHIFKDYNTVCNYLCGAEVGKSQICALDEDDNLTDCYRVVPKWATSIEQTDQIIWDCDDGVQHD